MRKQIFNGAISVAMLGAALIAGCGGGGGIGVDSSSSSSTTGTTTGSTTSTVAKVSLIASSTQLASSASTSSAGVTLTAIVKDANNNLLEDQTVTFSSTGGALVVTSSTSDSSGTATAVLTTGGDQTNQTITVTATSGGYSASVDIAEIGTSVAVSGSSVVGSLSTVSYTVTLTDSSGAVIAGKAITLKSALGNAISPSSATSNSSGQATFAYTGTTPGSDTLTASASSLAVSATKSISVSSSKLVFSTPADDTVIDFGTRQTVSVVYTESGSPVSGATVNFSATRGTFNGATLTSTTATTDSSGVATVTIQSDGAGGAGASTVSAQIASGPSAELNLTFNATTPASISLQASPTTIATSETSTVTAIIRDANNNLVADQVVNFTLNDITGGKLSAATGTTSQTGTVSVTYTASTATSATDGVQVSAFVSGTSVASSSPAKITVSGKALGVVLGPGNTASSYSDTVYQYPIAVLVTDSAGNPAPSTTSVALTIKPVAYQKGYKVYSDTVEAWVPDPSVPSSDANYNSTSRLPFGCSNEDVNFNGILDTGEDYNSSKSLEPGQVANITSSTTLDSAGAATVYVTYPKNYSQWVEVEVTAKATVSGSEGTAISQFVLPVLASDVSDSSVAPPGPISPYGTSSTCSDNS